MSGPHRYVTDRQDIVYLGDCSGCDLVFEIEGSMVAAAGAGELQDALEEFAELHSKDCDGNVSWIKQSEPTEVLR